MSPGLRRTLWVVTLAGFALTFTIAVTLFTLWRTVLDDDWYRSSIEHSHTYDRLYNEVLTDPSVAKETHHLLAGLPIDQSLVAASRRTWWRSPTISARAGSRPRSQRSRSRPSRSVGHGNPRRSDPAGRARAVPPAARERARRR